MLYSDNNLQYQMNTICGFIFYNGGCKMQFNDNNS